MLEIQNLCKSFGALKASDDLSLSVDQGTIHALIGPNGAGKTTLISQLSGYMQPNSGMITFDGQDLLTVPAHKRPHAGLVRSFQITSVFPELTVLDNICLVLQSMRGHAHSIIRLAASDYFEQNEAQEILTRVGLNDKAYSLTGNLAHGQKRQVEIAMALATKPKLLLLDEPMAGMGTEESLQIMDLLNVLRKSVTMLLVEHDMDVVFSLADKISVLVYGRVVASDTPENIRNNQDVQEAYLGGNELKTKAEIC
jgi:branched-chain amino acid transport system ATP-binding protein